jgi:hypothetical protein
VHSDFVSKWIKLTDTLYEKPVCVYVSGVYNRGRPFSVWYRLRLKQQLMI